MHFSYLAKQSKFSWQYFGGSDC